MDFWMFILIGSIDAAAVLVKPADKDAHVDSFTRAS
jgi:hypothetical protein